VIENIVMMLLHHYAPGAHATVAAVQKHGMAQPGKVVEEVVHEGVHDLMETVHLIAQIVKVIAVACLVVGCVVGAVVGTGMLAVTQHFFHFLP
jgi:hypothetical protein